MSSVDESGVSSNPPLCLWRNPTCCSDRSPHFSVSIQSKKNHTRRKKKNQLMKFTAAFWEGHQEWGQGRKECMRSENDVLMNANWKQLCLIKLNYFHPPGFETLSVTLTSLAWVSTAERRMKYKQQRDRSLFSFKHHSWWHVAILIHIFGSLHAFTMNVRD